MALLSHGVSASRVPREHCYETANFWYYLEQPLSYLNKCIERSHLPFAFGNDLMTMPETKSNIINQIPLCSKSNQEHYLHTFACFVSRFYRSCVVWHVGIFFSFFSLRKIKFQRDVSYRDCLILPTVVMRFWQRVKCRRDN